VKLATADVHNLIRLPCKTISKPQEVELCHIFPILLDEFFGRAVEHIAIYASTNAECWDVHVVVYI
jgi:hypothetical protein